ncbi:iron-containing redox enzyme family protein [Thermoplasma sp.]|uniref:iron-containing redox enzyme family protein n=1 Tax=Thermoplasma sp. TaxID=1973142 RepID=UPI00261053C7|nr:iron-containing redox enzyme family protein [Thermoplasma sp.]
MICPVCEGKVQTLHDLGVHFGNMSIRGDANHTSWIYAELGGKYMDYSDLEEAFDMVFSPQVSLAKWARLAFIRKFYTDPHPFIQAMQRPSIPVLLGYVIEHRFFLRNWIRTLSSVIHSTTSEEAFNYEIENVATEYIGFNGRPSHLDLLIRMGEALGMTRKRIMEYTPLPETSKAIEVWYSISSHYSWVDTMGAMHVLELVADRTLVDDGAKMHYFDPGILNSSEYPQEVRDFLMEGYKADVDHAGKALKIVESETMDDLTTRSIMIRSMDAFYLYLNARLRRSRMLEAAWGE